MYHKGEGQFGETRVWKARWTEAICHEGCRCIIIRSRRRLVSWYIRLQMFPRDQNLTKFVKIMKYGRILNRTPVSHSFWILFSHFESDSSLILWIRLRFLNYFESDSGSLILFIRLRSPTIDRVYLYFYISDKSPQMNEFITQIKSNSDLTQMFENIQKDAMASSSDAIIMDTSWDHVTH